MESIWILKELKKLDLLKNYAPWWWANALSVEVVVGTLLVQNAKWRNVIASLENLKNAQILSIDSDKTLQNLANSVNIENLIAPSGLYRQKSIRLIHIARAIIEDFGNFSSFCDNVNREWLLSQKGIGLESADAILNYACGREVMVVDKYSFKLLRELGMEIYEYDELQGWFMDLPLDEVGQLYGDISLAQVYARYHGKIVEYSKAKLHHLQDLYKAGGYEGI